MKIVSSTMYLPLLSFDSEGGRLSAKSIGADL
jgi:hypothetical protein